jgi:hypothetical protein
MAIIPASSIKKHNCNEFQMSFRFLAVMLHKSERNPESQEEVKDNQKIFIAENMQRFAAEAVSYMCLQKGCDGQVSILCWHGSTATTHNLTNTQQRSISRFDA